MSKEKREYIIIFPPDFCSFFHPQKCGRMAARIPGSPATVKATKQLQVRFGILMVMTLFIKLP